MRILVIEDDREAAAYLVKALDEMGHVAEHAADGDAGAFMAEEGGYDVLIVDRMLPKRDGLSVIEDMRRRGVALACCARLILTCLDRGLYPSWDAANLESVALARRLGYRPAGPYDAWELYRSPQTQKDGEGLFPPEKPNNP